MEIDEEGMKALTSTVEEGFEEIKTSQAEQAKALEEQKEALVKTTEELREEMEQATKAHKAQVASLNTMDYTKRMTAFKKTGMFFSGDKWYSIDDFFRAAGGIMGGGEPGAVVTRSMIAGRPGHMQIDEFENLQKALSEGTTTAGGYLVPNEYDDMILELLLEEDAITAYCQRLVTSRDNMFVNTESTTPQGAFIAEATGIETSTTDPVYGQSEIIVYAFKAGFKCSNELLADSRSNIGQYLTSRMTKQIAYAMQKYTIAGTGSSQPYGITAATAGTTTNYATLAWSNLLTAFYGITPPYRKSAIWGIPSAMMPTVLNLSDAGSRLIFQGMAAQVPPLKILGRPIIEDSSSWDANDIDLVDMDGYILVDRGATEFFKSEHTYADTNQTYFRFIRRWGGQLLRTNGYYKLNKT